MQPSDPEGKITGRIPARRPLPSVRGVVSCVGVVLAGVLLTSCAIAPTKKTSGSREYFSEKEYGVAASPRLVAEGKPVPKGGGRYQVGKPYVVKGKVYKPKEDPDYRAVGLASWYGSAFHGRKTANGELYDMAALTAAHPTLPLPSYARVTNLANDRSVIVRINDRGPFAKGRIIDLSSTAAELLDYKRAGTAKVKVEYVGPARMDGHDREMLLASYRGPNVLNGGDTMIASNPRAPQGRVVLASASSSSRSASSRNERGGRSLDIFGSDRLNPTPVSAPAFVSPPMEGNDPLGPLILRSGFSMSYAPTGRFGSDAHEAVAEMAGNASLRGSLKD